MPMFFVFLSVFGMLVGVFLIREGIAGDGIGAGVTLLVGGFVLVKECLDLIFANN